MSRDELCDALLRIQHTFRNLSRIKGGYAYKPEALGYRLGQVGECRSCPGNLRRRIRSIDTLAPSVKSFAFDGLTATHSRSTGQWLNHARIPASEMRRACSIASAPDGTRFQLTR